MTDNNIERIAFDIREVALMVGRSESTVRRAIKNGALRASYVSEHPSITRDAIRAWLDNAPTERATA